jgi:5-formyltetrahydrofolate cyclo-ligase
LIAQNQRDEIRLHIKALRTAYRRDHAVLLGEWSERIAVRVMQLCDALNARRVMCYYSLAGEVQTQRLLRRLIESGREVYLPVTGKDKQMNAVRLRDADAVHAGAFRVMEPDGDEVIEPHRLDLILIPGLAFDASGGRMGYGAGCYDRFLPKCRGVFAALAFGFQMIGCVPTQAHDVSMHYVITEQSVYDCRRERHRSHSNHETEGNEESAVGQAGI